MEIADARAFETPPRLDVAGYMLTKGVSPLAIRDDLDQVKATNQAELAGMTQNSAGRGDGVPVEIHGELAEHLLEEALALPVG